jgi:hypothetical protein
MQHEQVIALHKQGMPVEDIAREMHLEPLAVKTMVSQDPNDFTDEDRSMARKVIVAIAQGGMDIKPGDQLKAAMHIEGSKQIQSNGAITLNQIQRMLLEAKQVHNRNRVIDVQSVQDV